MSKPASYRDSAACITCTYCDAAMFGCEPESWCTKHEFKCSDDFICDDHIEE
jgi:hypothetical protein